MDRFMKTIQNSVKIKDHLEAIIKHRRLGAKFLTQNRRKSQKTHGNTTHRE
jgi:hypothetical protein